MGNNQNDIYLCQKPINAANRFKKKNLYYWVDPLISRTKENKAYMAALKEVVQIRSFQLWKTCMFELDSFDIDQNLLKIFLITSYSLPQQAYSIFQSQNKIHSIIIFANQKQNARQITAKYSKIIRYCQQFEDLLGQIRQIQARQMENIQFYCEERMQRLNRWMVNWLVLQQFSRQKGKKDFIELAKAIMQTHNEIKSYQKSYDVDKTDLQRDQMAIQWLMRNSFFRNIPTQMLRICRDTFSLSLIRQPLLDIYNAIRNKYVNSSYQQIQVFSRISLNNYEINQFKKRNFKYIYFSTFIFCSFDQGRKRSYANQFRFTIKLKGKISSSMGGYLIGPHEVIINLNNAFEIQQVDLDKGQIVIKIVQQKIQNKLQQSDQYCGLQMHTRYIKYLVTIIPGQILSSYLNDQLLTYQSMVKQQINLLSRDIDTYFFTRRLTYKVELSKLKLYFHFESLKVIQKELLEVKQITAKLDNDKQALFYKVKIYFMLIEIYMHMSEFTKFGKCIGRLKLLEKQQGATFNQQQFYKLKVYSIYCYIITNKSHLEENRELIKQIERQANSKLPEYIQVSQLYFIIMLTKIKCEQLLGNHKRSIQLFQELIRSIILSQGKNQVFVYFNYLKKQLQGKFIKIIDAQQQQQKRKKCTSSVPLAQLLNLSKEGINLTGIKLSLFLNQ